MQSFLFRIKRKEQCSHNSSLCYQALRGLRSPFVAVIRLLNLIPLCYAPPTVDVLPIHEGEQRLRQINKLQYDNMTYATISPHTHDKEWEIKRAMELGEDR